jgi:hypothetical protein
LGAAFLAAFLTAFFAAFLGAAFLVAAFLAMLFLREQKSDGEFKWFITLRSRTTGHEPPPATMNLIASPNHIRVIGTSIDSALNSR